MNWLLFVLCFITINAFSQTKVPLLEKLKKTQERLSGKFSDTIPNERLGFNPDQKKSRITIIIPDTENNAIGKIPNLIERQQSKPPIMGAYQESMVIALPQDHMPCIVPNMELFRGMPNGGGKRTLEKPIDPGIYLQKPKS